MQSLKSPYILYNQQSVGSTLHNNLLFITDTALEIYDADDFHTAQPPFAAAAASATHLRHTQTPM